MATIIKIANSSYLTKAGRLVNRKAHRRLIKKAASLSEAKKKVRGFRKILGDLQQMTASDPSKREFAVVAKKVGKGSRFVPGEVMPDGTPMVNLKNKDITLGYNQALLHSHPEPAAPLSVDDIYRTQKGGTVFAVDLEGSQYRATPKIPRTQRKLVEDTYAAGKQKILDSGIVREYIEEQRFANPNVDERAIKADIVPVVMHKLLDDLHKKGLVHYRAKLSPAMQRRVNKYKDIMRLELNRRDSSANFSSLLISKPKNSSYKHIPKSKWNKIPKRLRDEIRIAENRGNDKRVISLYKKVGIR